MPIEKVRIQFGLKIVVKFLLSKILVLFDRFLVMFKQLLVFVSILSVVGCSGGEKELKSKQDYQDSFSVEHNYKLMNPYAKPSQAAKLIVDFPSSEEEFQGIFDLDLPQGASLYKKDSDEQYLELRIDNIPARQSIEFKLSYDVGQTSKKEFNKASQPYTPIFPEILSKISGSFDKDKGFKEALELISTDWDSLKDLLPEELMGETNAVDEVTLIQKLVASDLFLSTGHDGDIVLGFYCAQEGLCKVEKQVIWLRYLKGEAVETEILADLEGDVRLLPVKEIKSPKQIADYRLNRNGVEAIGVVISSN